jgi:hypothetical protein
VWCQDNNLSFNVSKTKEHTPIHIDGAALERVKSLKFITVHITEDLTWSSHTRTVVKKAQLCLFSLRGLKLFGMSPQIYSFTIESIRTGCIPVWYGNCPVRKSLFRVVRTVGGSLGASLQSSRTYMPSGV